MVAVIEVSRKNFKRIDRRLKEEGFQPDYESRNSVKYSDPNEYHWRNPKVYFAVKIRD